MDNNPALLQAQKQRYAALTHAFSIIDQFAIPSLDPESMEHYDALKSRLTRHYAPIELNTVPEMPFPHLQKFKAELERWSKSVVSNFPCPEMPPQVFNAESSIGNTQRNVTINLGACVNEIQIKTEGLSTDLGQMVTDALRQALDSCELPIQY